jgi:hypothetical protein
MPLYFFLLESAAFEERIRPALASAWRQRSFEPGRSLCQGLLPGVQAFAERYALADEEPLVARVARGLPFDRDYWTFLVGEVLLYAAVDVPEIEVAPDTLRAILAPERLGQDGGAREQFAPIERAHFGSRDLRFGARLYRPESVGLNDVGDVARLAAYLGDVDPNGWTPADLVPLADLTNNEDRADELAFVQDWFPALQELYRRAAASALVVVCELLSSGRDY